MREYISSEVLEQLLHAFTILLAVYLYWTGSLTLGGLSTIFIVLRSLMSSTSGIAWRWFEVVEWALGIDYLMEFSERYFG